MTVEIDTGGLVAAGEILREIRKRISAEVSSGELADAGKNMIIERTGKGVDLKGFPFKPYTESYKRKRIKSGKGTAVDLRFSGQMLDSIASVTRESKSGSVIFIKGDVNILKAKSHAKGTGNAGVVRSFFGLAEAEKDELRDIFAKRIERAVKDAL